MCLPRIHRQFLQTSQEQRQKLIDIFIKEIYLYDDKIVFIFNHKDGTKTIKLVKIEGSDLCVNGAPKKPESGIQAVFMRMNRLESFSTQADRNIITPFYEIMLQNKLTFFFFHAAPQPSS